MLANHADVDARDEYGQTPFHLTADWGYMRLAELLLTHGADVNAKDCDNETPLHIAARAHQSELAELLLAHGADVNAKDRDGWTPLHPPRIFLGRITEEEGPRVNAKMSLVVNGVHICTFSGGIKGAGTT